MISKVLRTTAEGIGFTYMEAAKSGKDSLYGVYGGYLVTLYDAGSSQSFYISYFLRDGDGEEADSVRLLELSESLKHAAEDVRLTECDVQPDGLFCKVSAEIDRFVAFLDRTVALLQEQGADGVTHCSRCGNRIGKRPPKKLFAERRNHLLCEHCALELLEESTKATDVDLPPKHTGKGLLGAVGGGLLAVVAYLLLYTFLAPLFAESSFEVRYVLCLLGFFAAWAVYAGFRLFSKRPCASAYAIVGVVTALSVAAGQYLGSFVGYAKIQGFSISEAVRLPSMWLIHLRSAVDKATVTYDQSLLDLYDAPSSLFWRLLVFSLLFAAIGATMFLFRLRENGYPHEEPPEIETLRIQPSEPKPEEP